MIPNHIFPLKPFSAYKQYFESLVRTEKGGLYLNGTFRLVVLAAIYLYFQIPLRVHTPAQFSEYRLTLWAFIIYNTIVVVLGIRYYKWFLKKQIKFVQAMCEIIFYTFFIVANGNQRSEMIWLYLIPIFIAAHYINFKGLLAVLAIIFFSMLLGMQVITNWDNSLAFYFNFFPRIGAIWIVGFLMTLRPPPSVKEDVLADVAPLNAVLQTFRDGIFIVDDQKILLFVNETLQALHGPLVSREKAHVYFRCRPSLFNWEDASENKMIAPVTGEFVDRDNQSYQVEIAIRAIHDEIGQVTEYIVNVKNLKQDEKVQRELRNQVSRLFEERNIWVNTYYELGKSLLIYKSVDDLTAFLVGEVRRRLGAEQAGLFFLKDGRLVLQDSGGIEMDEIAGEYYNPGQGITGKIIEPGPNYAQPVRLNKVFENVEKKQAVYDKYRSLLPSGEVRHLLAVPFNGHDGLLGVLRALNRLDANGNIAAEGFRKEDEDLLTAIAAMASVAIDKIRLLEETTRRYEKLNVLYEVVEKISKPYELDELFQVIADEARQHVPEADKCAIYQLVGDELIAKATSEEVKKSSGLPPVKRDEGIAGLAIKAEASIYVKDTTQDPIFVRRGMDNLRSLLVHPLLVDGKVFGTLSLNSSQTAAFSPTDVDFIESLGYHAAIAIRQARLVKQLHERSEQAEAMNRVFMAINKKIRPSSLLKEIIQQLSLIVPFNSISIQLIEGRFLKIMECRGFDDNDEVRKLHFPLKDRKYPNSIVMEKLEPLIVKDVQIEYPHFQQEHDQYHSGNIRSWMGIPIVHRKKAIGMIAFDSVATNFYDERMKALAMSIANALSSAIANAHLFDEKKKQYERVKRLHEDLSQLFEASMTINQMTSIASVCQAVVDQAHHLVNPDYTGLVLVDASGQPYAGFESEQLGRPILENLRETGITRDVINSGMPSFLPHIRYNDHHNPWIYEHGFHSYAVLPIINHEGKVSGVLSVHSKNGNAFYSKERLLETFCNHAAGSIENAFHEQEKDQQGQALERMLGASTRLASTRLLESVKLEEVLDIAVEEGRKIFGIENSHLYLVDDNGENLWLTKTTYCELSGREIHPIPVDSKNLIAVIAREGGAPVITVCSVFEWIGMPIHPPVLSSRSPDNHNLMMIGRLEDSKDQCVGVLALETGIANPRMDSFSDFDKSLFATFTSLIGMAIERAHLIKQLNSQARKEARELLRRDLHELEGVLMGTVLMRANIGIHKFDQNDMAGVHQELETVAKAAEEIQQSLNWIHNDLKNDLEIRQKGLVPMLEHLATLQGIEVREVDHEKMNLSGQIEYALYKIGREALNNISEHAMRATTTICLEKDGDEFVFLVKDCGPGFDLDEVKGRGEAYGLETMDGWAKGIGAHLDILTKPQEGTCIEVRGRIDFKGGEA